MAETCSWCQMGRFEGFEIRCELSGELLEPLSAACQEYVPADAKQNIDAPDTKQ